jgi:hypothetical protein
MRFLIVTTILEHFGEDAFGRGCHGHASKSKETLYSVSCDLSAASAPGKSAGSGTRTALIETK